MGGFSAFSKPASDQRGLKSRSFLIWSLYYFFSADFSTHPLTYLLIHSSTCPPFHPFTYPPALSVLFTHPSIYPSTQSSIHYVQPSNHLFIHLPTHPLTSLPSTHLSIHTFICPLIHSPFHPYIHSSIPTHLQTHSFIHLHPFTHLPNHPSSHPTIHTLIYPANLTKLPLRARQSLCQGRDCLLVGGDSHN